MKLDHYYLQQMGIELWQKRAHAGKKFGATLMLICARDEEVREEEGVEPGSRSHSGSHALLNEHVDLNDKASILLQKMLATLGLAEAEIYRVWLHKEANAHRQSSLQEQVRAISPKLVLALGKTACKQLTCNHKPLAELRGTWCNFQETPCLISYHPAALLRNPACKKLAYQDLLALKLQLTGN